MKISNDFKANKSSPFQLKVNLQDELTSIVNRDDPFKMNWVKQGEIWGEVRCDYNLDVAIKRNITGNQLIEQYTFTNNTNFDINTLAGHVGICLPLPDYYTKASVGLTQCSNTHIWCGETCSYLMSLRQGGQAPHLGLLLRKGSLKNYSVERSYNFSGHEEEVSNNRGLLILHPENFNLHPGESYTLDWQLFWFDSKAQFKSILQNTNKYIDICSDSFVVTGKEPIQFNLTIGNNLATNEAPRVFHNHQQIACDWHINSGKVQFTPIENGENRFDIYWQEQHTHATFFRTLPLNELAKKRIQFITQKQQCHDTSSVLNGAYLIYDNEEHQQYYSHVNDHNGGRERVGMGVLVAYYLRHFPNQKINQSLQQYVQYVVTNLFDPSDGTVYNDAPRNNDEPRLYNYPWVAQLFLEMYQLDKEQKYLDWYYKVMKRFYQNGGTTFYAIGIPMYESIQVFKAAKRFDQANQLLEFYQQNVDYIVKNGRNYPESEVSYEQAIVGPAATYVLEMYQLTGQEKYLKSAKLQLESLEQFEGFQPDYHMNEVAIRHWDGYWFGKNKILGDTFPHYWTALSGLAFLNASTVTKIHHYQTQAHKSLRASLCLYHNDGSASCSMVYPFSVNTQLTHVMDPWANDQDWGLYYALKYENL